RSPTATAKTGNLLAGFARSEHDFVEHLESLSWPGFLDLLDQINAELQQFLAPLTLVRKEALQPLFERFLAIVTKKLAELLDAESLSILSVDHQAGVLRRHICRKGHPITEPPIPLTRGIAGRVVVMNQTINVTLAQRDPDFDPAVDGLPNRSTHSLICIALHDRQRKVCAVAQLLNKKNGLSFTEQDAKRSHSCEDVLTGILEVALRAELELSASQGDGRETMNG